MTTLYNGQLFIQGLTLYTAGQGVGVTTSDTIVSVLDSMSNNTSQKVMLEIGSCNMNLGNKGSVYKYLLGMSNRTDGLGGEFHIQSLASLTTGAYTSATPITRFMINASGNVGIGTTTPAYLLDVNGTTRLNGQTTLNGVTSFLANVWHTSSDGYGRLLFFTPDNISYYKSGPGGGHTFRGGDDNDLSRINSSGDIWAAGNVTAYSDIRVKDNIITIDSPIEKIMKMRGVYYTRIDVDINKRHVGVIAQEVEKVLPEVVMTDTSENKNKSVAYGNITALLIEGIKAHELKLQAIIKHLGL